MKRFIPLLVLLAVPVMAQTLSPWKAPFSTEKSQAYTCVYTAHAPVIDGKLDEAEWAQAQPIENFIVPPSFDWVKFSMREPRRATSLTHARFMWDDKYLYFGAVMEDRDLYCATPFGHDLSFGADDIIEVFVKPSDEIPYYWELHAMPTGGTRDYFYARRNAGNDARWKKYESGIEAKATMIGTLNNWEDRDTSWTAEMRVPWSAFERMGGIPKVGDLWRFLVSRYDYSVHLEDGVELSAAAPLPLQSYHLFEYYPYMKFVK